MWTVELFNKWSASVAHKLHFKSEDEAVEAAKAWEDKELWEVAVIEIIEEIH